MDGTIIGIAVLLGLGIPILAIGCYLFGWGVAREHILGVVGLILIFFAFWMFIFGGVFLERLSAEHGRPIDMPYVSERQTARYVGFKDVGTDYSGDNEHIFVVLGETGGTYTYPDPSENVRALLDNDFVIRKIVEEDILNNADLIEGTNQNTINYPEVELVPGNCYILQSVSVEGQDYFLVDEADDRSCDPFYDPL